MFDKYPRLCVDVIIPDRKGHVIVTARGHGPYEGAWCFPGGKVDEGETVEQAALREVREEIGIRVRIDRVFAIRSSPDRDPRGHYVSIVLIAHPTDEQPRTSKEATRILHVPRSWEFTMAFDHATVLREYWALGSSPTAVVLA